MKTYLEPETKTRKTVFSSLIEVPAYEQQKIERFRHLLDIMSNMIDDATSLQKVRLLEALSEARGCLVKALQAP